MYSNPEKSSDLDKGIVISELESPPQPSKEWDKPQIARSESPRPSAVELEAPMLKHPRNHHLLRCDVEVQCVGRISISRNGVGALGQKGLERSLVLREGIAFMGYLSCDDAFELAYPVMLRRYPLHHRSERCTLLNNGYETHSVE